MKRHAEPDSLSLSKQLLLSKDSNTSNLLGSITTLELLDAELQRIKRGNSELALVCFDFMEEDSSLTQNNSMTQNSNYQCLLKILREQTLSCDAIGCLPTGHCCLIYPGAGAFKTQLLLEKVIDKCKQYMEIEIPLFWAGISYTTGDEDVCSESLINDAIAALNSARATGITYTVHRSMPTKNIYDTLVCSNEKRFLFTGRN